MEEGSEKAEETRDEEEEEERDREAGRRERMPSSLLHLLSTDNIDFGHGEERDEFMLSQPPPPHLLALQQRPLDAISEEDTDDLRSSSATSPRTVFDYNTSRSRSEFLSPLSTRSTLSEYRSPQEALSPSSLSTAMEEHSDGSPEVTMIERRSTTEESEAAATEPQPSQQLREEEAGSSHFHHFFTESTMLAASDADRDTTEESVYGIRPLPMDDGNSLDSVSIRELNDTQESAFDHSNHIDEAAIVQMNTVHCTTTSSYPPPSPPLDLPPPPPPLPPPTSTSSSFYNVSSHRPLLSAESENLEPIEVDVEASMQRVARYGQIYSDSAKSRVRTTFDERSEQGMSSPPSEPAAPSSLPPPLPLPYFSSSSTPVFSTSSALPTTTGKWREGEFLHYSSSEHAPSRSTVREIPVHRAPSSTAHSLSTPLAAHPLSSLPPLSMTTTQQHPHSHHDIPEEYYRREVLTRTVITRSSETLSQQPPLGRSSPIERYITYPTPDTREERTVEYRTKYSRDLEEEERVIREEREKRRGEEEERRRRDEELRRELEVRERERLDKLRRDWELKERELEGVRQQRELVEKDRIGRDRKLREEAEKQRREEWERRENERRALEDEDLTRRRELERQRLLKERELEERMERERLEREREMLERQEKERMERERIEKEIMERERIEIERIERIKREKLEREQKEREREKEEQERLKKEREELERIAWERRELERKEWELREQQRKEAEQMERERLEDEARERRRREEEARAAALLTHLQREAMEKERLRKLQEQEDRERIERLRQEQERRELEKQEFERRERERQEEERREKELLDAQRIAREQRDRERIDDERREWERQEEERKEREKRENERRAAMERERQRQIEEAIERDRIAALEKTAMDRRLERQRELEREKERMELQARTVELAELERRQADKRDRERQEDERRLAELQAQEAAARAKREQERIEAIEREATRRREHQRSRDKLDVIAREKTEKEKFEAEKRALLLEYDSRDRRKNDLLSKETLEKLTRKPYFSRENLSNAEVTTKVERQVIERVDRNLWVEDRLIPTTQTTYSYALEGGSGGGEDPGRDRIFSQNSDLIRSGSSRTSSRLRARMDRARRDFIAGGADSTDAVGSRFRKSEEDLSRRPLLYRGPLLQKFHDGEFTSSTRPGDLEHLPYPRVGPSPYGQMEETNLDDIHRRSGSVLAENRYSRSDWQAVEAPGAVHTRSKSADYLMDKKSREETIAPENELQKQPRTGLDEGSPRVSEHELRFRKSTEKIDVPDWYRENRRPTGRATDLDAMTQPRQPPPAYSPSTSHSAHFSQPFSYMAGGYAPGQASSPSGGADLPVGMFDRYKDEIEELRRSRSSLHQTGVAEQTTQVHRQEEAAAPMHRRFQSQEMVSSRNERVSGRTLPGYTVSAVPDTWEVATRSRRSRVIEVADTFVGAKKPPITPEISPPGGIAARYGGRVTLEEVLDSIFHDTQPSHPPPPEDTSLPLADHLYEGNHDGPSIYTHNYMLMDQVIKRPERAEQLLKSEQLFVRCSYCHRTRELSSARLSYVSCKHCYTYYCSRECRVNDWTKHSSRCSFARINTLCKDVIMKVRSDTEAQWWMSRVAREGFAARGRGSVNIRLASPHLSQAYVSRGWQALAAFQPASLLFYYTVAALVQERKDPSLIALCRKYDPNDKFILSVSIIADVEHCPQTPPPETSEWPEDPVERGRGYGRQPGHAWRSSLVDLRTLVPTDV